MSIATASVLGASGLGRDLANCTRQRLCNGEYLCADVCKLGTVVPDAHASRALKLQRALQYDDRLARQTFVGSHNSAISLAYGYGIEEDGFERLLNTTLFVNDDVGEGVDSSFTLTDQLDLGVRHLEIDITAGYFRFPPTLHDFFVCHSPVPLDEGQILKVELAARRQHIALGDWRPERLSCLGTTLPLKTVLLEVRAWLDAHAREFVVLYLDTKPLTMTGEAQANAMSALLRGVFNESMWTWRDGPPEVLLNQTVSSLIERGKRLYIEDHADAYRKATDRIVYTPAVWSHQFGPTALSAFPECAIGDDRDWYTNVSGPARPFARGLYNGGSTLSDGSQKHAALRAAATACGVGVVSPNYLQPGDMSAFVWTWDHGEPAGDDASGQRRCVVQKPNGRWATTDCEHAAASLPLACRLADNDRVWKLLPAASNRRSAVVHTSTRPACGAGWLARPPTNGFANGLLRAAAAAVTNASVLLNVSRDGLAGSPAWL